MIDALNDVIKLKVEEVLKSHFKATPEDFNAATFAIMKELSTVGGNLDKMLESGEGVLNLIGDRTEEGQTELTEQLTRELTNSGNTIKIINTDEDEG
jgi:hypothetical protein